MFYLEISRTTTLKVVSGGGVNTVLDFLQAEKTVRIRSLVSMGFNMKDIGLLYKNANEISSSEHEEEVKAFVRDF